MASRPSWSGFIRFNLIAIPVKGYNAAAGGGKIGFHLLHSKCHSRIRYKKVCPIHGEVSNDEIVSGYEVSKGHYAIVNTDERGELKSEDDKAIAVEHFVALNAIDPLYYSGRTYYLVPDGKVAQKPYAVLLAAMRDQNRQAIGQVVFAGRAQLAVVRPCEQVLAMTLLTFASELKKPSSFADEVTEPELSADERKLAETLIAAATVKKLDLPRYKDEYSGKLQKLVERKAKSAVRSPTADSEPAVINLMDALRQSLKSAQHGGKLKVRRKPPAGHKHPKRKTG